MRIQQPRYFIGTGITGAVFLILLFESIPLGSASFNALIVLSVLGIFFLTILCREIARGFHVVEFDELTQTVNVSERKWCFIERTNRYPLSNFRSVISYLTPGKFSFSRIDLVTQRGGEYLHIISLWPEGIQYESVECAELRTTIAKRYGLADGGFLGTRWPGVPASNNSRSLDEA